MTQPRLSQQRFLIFGGEFEREPNGGMRDYMMSFNIKAEAIAYCKGWLARSSGGWAHVYDQQDRKEVWAHDKPGDFD